MADLERYAGSVISGGISLLAGAFAAYRGLKKRLDSLETKIGSNKDGHETGVFLLLVKLDDAIKKFRREVDGWNDYPPSWAQRLFDRAKEYSVHPDVGDQLEDLSERLSDIENRIDRCITSDTYHEDSLERAEEIAVLREDLAEVKGLIRGITSNIGSPFRR